MKRRSARDNALNSPTLLLLGSCLQAAFPRNTRVGWGELLDAAEQGRTIGTTWKWSCTAGRLWTFGKKQQMEQPVCLHTLQHHCPALAPSDFSATSVQSHKQLIEAGSNQKVSRYGTNSDLLSVIQSDAHSWVAMGPRRVCLFRHQKLQPVDQLISKHYYILSSSHIS